MTVWVMVLVAVLSDGDSYAQTLGEYRSMDECFEWRERAVHNIGGQWGVPPNGFQVVCIPHDKEE